MLMVMNVMTRNDRLTPEQFLFISSWGLVQSTNVMPISLSPCLALPWVNLHRQFPGAKYVSISVSFEMFLVSINRGNKCVYSRTKFYWKLLLNRTKQNKKIGGSFPGKTKTLYDAGNLTVVQLSKEDQGQYECVAQNVVASVITTSLLIIEGFRLHCNAIVTSFSFDDCNYYYYYYYYCCCCCCCCCAILRCVFVI